MKACVAVGPNAYIIDMTTNKRHRTDLFKANRIAMARRTVYTGSKEDGAA